MRRLLILACSASKSPAVELLPARERYTGPLWQTLRAVDPAGRLAFASVLSARHGWCPADALLEAYEQRLTPDRAREIAAGGITKGWPEYRGLPDGPSACPWLARAAGWSFTPPGAVRIYSHPFEAVAIVGGGDYCRLGAQLVREAQERGYIVPSCRPAIICDQIGYMRQQMRAWLTQCELFEAVP